MAECLQWNRPHDSLCCMEICPPEKLTNVSHFISRGLFCNYQKDVAARRAATSMFWFKENQRPVPLIRRPHDYQKARMGRTR